MSAASSPFDRSRLVAPPPDFRTNPRALRSHLDRRPYWVLEYMGREALFEGDRCRCGRHEQQDWGCRPGGSIEREIGLYTPDGMLHKLGGVWADMTGKLFQLKQAARGVTFGGTGYHLIGMIAGLDGQCVCYAWEFDVVSPLGGHIVGPFRDNVYSFVYGGLGRLGLENLGLRL